MGAALARRSWNITVRHARRIHQLCLRIVRDLERHRQAFEPPTEPDNDA